MVRTGVMCAYGTSLRSNIGASVENRFSAFSVGLAVTAVLQSSTATALIVSSFAAKGLMTAGPALAVMLGADAGTTLIAQVLSFNINWLSPLLLITGYMLYTVMNQYHHRQLGRAIFGLGLMLLSLTMIKAASLPLRESVVLRSILEAIQDELLLTLLIGAVTTWLAHSSLAIILLIVSLVASQAIGLEMGIVLVLGANLGGTIPPILATLRSGATGLRVTIGNACFKVAACIMFLPFLDLINTYIVDSNISPERIIVHFHTFFNLCIALIFIWFTPMFGRFLTDIIPEKVDDNNPSKARFLDRSVIETPYLAISNGNREALRLGTKVEELMEDVQRALSSNDRTFIESLNQQAEVAQSLKEEIKRYLTAISRKKLSKDESKAAFQLLTATTNFAHTASILGNIASINLDRVEGGFNFSPLGLSELEDIHVHISKSLKIAIAAMTQKEPSLKSKIEEAGGVIKKLAAASRHANLERMKEGLVNSIETSATHTDILRDFVRIQHHVKASVATPKNRF